MPARLKTSTISLFLLRCVHTTLASWLGTEPVPLRHSQAPPRGIDYNTNRAVWLQVALEDFHRAQMSHATNLSAAGGGYSSGYGGSAFSHMGPGGAPVAAAAYPHGPNSAYGPGSVYTAGTDSVYAGSAAESVHSAAR
jgi:hypothetical protein